MSPENQNHPIHEAPQSDAAPEELLPSYLSLGGTVSKKKNREEQTRDTGVVGLHDENLFDENERASDGGLSDEATGKNYDNSTMTDEGYYEQTKGGHFVDPMQDPDSQDVMGGVADEYDAAAEWLAQHEDANAGTVNDVDTPEQRVA